MAAPCADWYIALLACSTLFSGFLRSVAFLQQAVCSQLIGFRRSRRAPSPTLLCGGGTRSGQLFISTQGMSYALCVCLVCKCLHVHVCACVCCDSVHPCFYLCVGVYMDGRGGRPNTAHTESAGTGVLPTTILNDYLMRHDHLQTSIAV